jgi:hypothetical protein
MTTTHRPISGLPLKALLLCSIWVSACAIPQWGQLQRVETPTATELKQNWTSYDVYYRLDSALLFKLKDHRNIRLDHSWETVASEYAIDAATFFSVTYPPQRIVGRENEVFGYLIYSIGDRVVLTLVEPGTLKLDYYEHRTGGP